MEISFEQDGTVADYGVRILLDFRPGGTTITQSGQPDQSPLQVPAPPARGPFSWIPAAVQRMRLSQVGCEFIKTRVTAGIASY